MGRAFVIHLAGKTHLIGLSPDCHLRVAGLPQNRLTYGVQSFCWEQAEAPDFPRNGRGAEPNDQRSRVCHVLISHLDAARNVRMVAEWRRLDPDSFVLLAHGGSRADFEALPPDIEAVFIDDPALRTRDHAREKQEYLGVIKAVAARLVSFPELTHVHLAEYDVVPMVKELGKKLVAALRAENADLSGSGIFDLTGTIHPHFLNQAADEAMRGYFREISCREDRERVLTMLGCTSTWTRECFLSVAALNPPGRIYLEMASPTLAHHLGWRVRPLPEAQHKFLTFTGDLGEQAEGFAREGAWMIHPSKKRW